MGFTGYSSSSYDSEMDEIKKSGSSFSRSKAARSSGDYTKIADILNPKNMKGGFRVCDYAPGFNDALPIFISIDATGSMNRVPHHVQEKLPTLIDLILEQGISDRPNVLFFCHDDYTVVANGACQMSQFETGASELLASTNEMVIPSAGGGNDSESYNLAFYAAAYHTKLECFEKNGEKGFFFMICDEMPTMDRRELNEYGVTQEEASEVFGDSLGQPVDMLTCMKKTMEKYHVFIIRPGDTNGGGVARVSDAWKEAMTRAGGNSQHVLDIPTMDDIIPTVLLTVARLFGSDDEVIQVLKGRGEKIAGAIEATSHIVKGEGALAKVDVKLPTKDDGSPDAPERR